MSNLWPVYAEAVADDSEGLARARKVVRKQRENLPNFQPEFLILPDQLEIRLIRCNQPRPMRPRRQRNQHVEV
jgi:hypothetical protein